MVSPPLCYENDLIINSMTTRTITDGGYYAIKGFAYQIDKTILELLNTTNENEKIYIEQIQDISLNDYVIQVKYKETAKLVSSQINKPISQLIEEYKKNNQRKYILFVYFADLNGYDNKVDQNKKIIKETLDELLGNKKNDFTEQEKINFVNNFYLNFAPEFQTQFNNILIGLKEKGFGNTDDEAVFYYANISDYIYKKVCNNPTADIQNRTCTQKEIFDYLKNGKKLIFNSAFKEYKGEEQYLKFVKAKFVKAKKNQENFIYIGNINTDSSVTRGKLVVDIIDKYYRGATYDIKPLTFIISDSFVEDIKKELIAEDIIFNDGYEHIQFKENAFFMKPIINRKTARNGSALDTLAKISFKLRILSSSKFKEIADCIIQPKIIYYFDSNILDNFESSSFLKIDNLNTKQINDIFTF